MSEEQLKAFLDKVKGDTSFQEKLRGAADAESALSIAKEAGFAITTEDIQSMQSASHLSDDELEGVAGGAKFSGGSFWEHRGTPSIAGGICLSLLQDWGCGGGC